MEQLELRDVSRLAGDVLDEVEVAVVGKRETLTLVLAAILAGGHVLLEDFPGLGKTLAARSFAQTLGLDFARAQFTPDLLPADLTGSFVYDQRAGEFAFRRGPLFTGLLLADEINRTPPRTQAALLEAMQEHQITVEGETFVLEPPFHVLATANPVEYEGTYPLPEAQLDRFMMRTSFGYPSVDDEWDVLHRRLDRRQEDQTLRQITDASTAARDAAGGGAGDRRRERRALLRGVGESDTIASSRADGILAAWSAGSAAGLAGLGDHRRPRLCHPGGRQGRGPVRAGPPHHGETRVVDESGVGPHRRRRGRDLRGDARRVGAGRGPPVNTSRLAGPWSGGDRWRPTMAHVRASVGAVVLVADRADLATT